MRTWFLPAPLEGKGRREGAVVQVVGTLRCSSGVFTPPHPFLPPQGAKGLSKQVSV